MTSTNDKHNDRDDRDKRDERSDRDERKSQDDGDDDKPTIEFLKGITEFNEREFFECHETLELVWRAQTTEKREFTQGIIQTAVAYYHLERGNTVGAIKLFHRAMPRLLKFAPYCFRVDVLALTDPVGQALASLEASTSGQPVADKSAQIGSKVSEDAKGDPGLLIPPIIKMLPS